MRSVTNPRFSLSSTDLTAENSNQVGNKSSLLPSPTDLTAENSNQVGYMPLN